MNGIFLVCSILISGMVWAEAFYYRYDGAHIYGGKRYPGTFHNYTDCLRMCHNMPSCLATDWDDTTLSCWLHDAETACGMLIMKPSCISLRKSTACVGDPPPQLYYRYNGYHIKGGVQYSGTFDSFVSCTRMCDGMPSCLATDWNRYSKTCWLHTSLTGCGELMPKQNCTTFRKASACKAVSMTTTMTSPISTTRAAGVDHSAYYQYQYLLYCKNLCAYDVSCLYTCLHYMQFTIGRK
ncbi:uncharacterized protein LOC106177818 [Lingula anatina]|uniref:Uncharacterized protein LOC106177818 n=1 Tax=Lingula anatina TaxID=7574 RepID=A0A1S3K1A4_LINAN|nr:uncharacterized protein LOC106177818 [Lingula anatina]|eukprot:XP_013416169.1 uncharacterized protein LOC106177818 [Lingula anatina]